MNTTQLECFVNIASTLNFVKTAELMSLTQPAVSKQLQSLERELGVRLLDRSTRHVSLTTVGERFLPEAREMLQAYYHSRDWILSYSQIENYYLRIGYSDPHAINRVSQTLTQLRKKHSNIYPRFTLNQPDANLARLEHGQLDLVVSIKDYSYSNKDIIFMELKTERFVCVVRKDHPLAAVAGEKKIVTTDQLWTHQQVLAIPPYLMHNQFMARHSLLPINDKIVNYSCKNNSEAYGLVLAGFGFCMVPTYLLMPHPDLAFLEWKQSPRTPMGIYYRKGSPKDNPILLDYLKAAKTIYAD